MPFAASAEVIRLIRPDVHAKNLTRPQHGVELSAETISDQEATRAAGSQLRFTKSPKKATGYHEAFTPEVNNHLSELRSRFSTAEIIEHVESLREMEVVLVGETILDEYVYCDALGKSGKEPVLAMRHICGERHAGGVLAIANHLANLLRQGHALYLPRAPTIRKKISCVNISARRFVRTLSSSKTHRRFSSGDSRQLLPLEALRGLRI